MEGETQRRLAVTPVVDYRAPRYPTAEAACDHPALLASLPRRWYGKPAVCTALFASLALGLGGCAQPQAPAPGTTQGPQVSTLPTQLKSSSEPKQANAVPIFPHGEGRGAYGCVSVAPPVFLSEEEAAQVVREEAKQYGVDFGPGAAVLSERLPYTDLYQQGGEGKTHAGSIELDGYDAKTGIGFEFVSVNDLQQWQSPNPEMFSSVESYDARGTAERLAQTLPGVAVFYDPMSADYEAFDFSFDWEAQGETDEERSEAYGKAFEEARQKYDTEQRAKSTENLRAQVRDFLDWLKGQDVI